jgi:phage recombination protein Bet
LAETEPIEISVGMVRNILCVKSRSGREPGDSDVIKFMMLCKARSMIPFVGDAYLLGYDSDVGTQWNLITAIQALRKRAEANPNFDGCRCGVILLVDGRPIEREGALLLDGEILVGGWAEVLRKDRSVPERRTVKLSVYDTGKSRWRKDPGGMIVKCAEAAALRAAFPSDLAGMYLRDEFGEDQPETTGTASVRVQPATTLDQLRERMGSPDEGIDPPDRDEDYVQDEPAPDVPEPPAEDGTPQDESEDVKWK